MLQFDKFSWIELCFEKKENLLMQIIVYVVFAIRRTLWYWIGERQSPYYHNLGLIEYSINLIVSMARRISSWDIINPAIKD